jgi:sec-independent protein translocase protein TatA
MFDAILQPTHLIVILAVVLLVLGPKRLPGAGRALGQGLKEFKGSLTGNQKEET